MIDPLRVWRRHLPSRFQDLVILRRSAFFLIPVVVLVVAFAAFTLPKPLTMVAASARAETLDIKVSNPDEASFALPRARIGARGACLTEIVVRPDQDSTVIYTRPIGGPLVVSVRGRSSWRNREALLGSKTYGVAEFRVDPNDRSCTVTGHVRLPIAGELTIGTVATGASLGEQQMPVLSGDLKVYGRAVDSIFFGKISLHWLESLTNAEPGTLYVAETIVLPAGSHVGQAVTGTPRSPARWWGFVDADMTDAGRADRGLWIEASTNASTLELVAPAPRTMGRFALDDPDVVSLTLAARLVGDPNLRWLLAIVTFMVLVAGVQAQFLSIPAPEKTREDRP